MGVKRIAKAIIMKEPLRQIVHVLCNRIRVVQGNTFSCACLLKRSRIDVVGRKNSISIGQAPYANEIRVMCHGNCNQIRIADNVLCKNLTIWIEDDNNVVVIGRNTAFTGSIHLSAIEGTRIDIGENCLFSSGIDIRTGDGHSILNLDGSRRNPSLDVSIGNHTWCGRNAVILKGVHLQHDTVVGCGSIVTNSVDRPNVVVAGNPARVVSKDIGWHWDRK